MPLSRIFQSSFCLPSLFNIPIHYNKYTYYIEKQLASQLMTANNIFFLHILDTRKASVFPDPSSYFTSSVFSQTLSSIICLQYWKSLTKSNKKKYSIRRLISLKSFKNLCLKIFYFTGFLKAKIKNMILKKQRKLGLQKILILNWNIPMFTFTTDLGCQGKPPYRAEPNADWWRWSRSHPGKGQKQTAPCCLHQM